MAIILGFDPGVADTGFGIINDENGKLICLEYGSIKTAAQLPLPERLVIIYSAVQELLKKYSPSLISIEQLFFSKNVKTAMAVGQARGVVLLACEQLGVPIMEFTPNQVKQAVSSYGGANKEQVQRMVQMLLRLEEIPKPDDAADALAIAICGSGNRRII
jgi:crossover junction endodeoxyribonuclease RuvC